MCGQESEGVPHDSRYTLAAIRPISGQPSVEGEKGDQRKVGFRLAAARREPEQVHDVAVRVSLICERRGCKQDEAELEWPPLERPSPALVRVPGVLDRHRAVRKRECTCHRGIRSDAGRPVAHAGPNTPAAVDVAFGLGAISLWKGADGSRLRIKPLPICGGQLLECFGKDLGRRVGEPLGGQRLAVGPAAQRVEDGVAVRARRRDGRVGDPGGGHHRGRAGVFAVVPSRGARVSSREFERGSVEQVDGAVVIVHDRAPRRTRDKLGCASGTNFEVHLEECGGFRGSASTVARNRGVVEERHRGEDALPGRR